ncbi:MAG: hypothetical protein HDR01_00390 [Lachnospiraceae bacterium]|nr:hypothetical protein [Lachnospiraceae bacterium]
MSSNTKNIIRPEFLKNFTQKIKVRYIVLERGNQQFKDIDKLISSINRDLNLIIQELNLRIRDRQLPYITLKSCYGNITSNKRIRVFLHDDDTDIFYEQEIHNQLESDTEISHILDLLVAASFKKITISALSCDAELIIDYKLLKHAIVDIILDIVMFNSFSFLKNMKMADKKKLSEEKYLFFQEKNFDCFYDCPKEKIMYFSLAFLARNESGFNMDDYIDLWDKFIETYYPNCKHQEKSIIEQLKQHVDYEELPKGITKKFVNLLPGAYLLLRTNKDRTEDLHPTIYSVFGIKKYRKGKIKIVPIDEFDTYKELLEHLDVSAFKIVKQ